MLEYINSLKNEKIKKIYKDLYSQSKNYVLLQSWVVFLELIKKNIQFEYIFCIQEWYDKHFDVLSNLKTKIIICNEEVIKKLSKVTTPIPFIAICKFKIANFKIKDNKVYTILNDIKDPTNMSNIIRTGVAFDCKEFFISRTSVNLFNSKVVRASMGSWFQIAVNYYDDIYDLIKQLKQKKFELIATTLTGNKQKITEYKPHNKNLAIIVGNESHGLDKKIIDACDTKLFINMKNIDSLNVSSAFAIALFWLTKDLING